MTEEQIKVEIAKAVCMRFIDMRSNTPRHMIVVKFENPAVLDEMEMRNLIKTNSSREEYLPTVGSFAVLGDEHELYQRARAAYERTTYALWNLYRSEGGGVDHEPIEFEIYANKLFSDPAPAGLIPLGLYLVREFGALSTMRMSADQINVENFRIGEQVIRMRDSAPWWMHRVQASRAPLQRFLAATNNLQADIVSGGAEHEIASGIFDETSFSSQIPPVEGLDHLKQEGSPHLPALHFKAHSIFPERIPGVPRAFISYSWDGGEHEEWVLELARRLQGESGVQIIFDRWHLNPGQDKLHFMEQAVHSSDFVVIVCTEKYAQRANDREGGVGYESGSITSQMAEDMATNKFIPILRHGSFKTSLPIYMKGRLGVNLNDEPYREDEYERLIRVLHGEPLQPPPVGKKPDFTKKTVKAAITSVVDATMKTTSRDTKVVPPVRPTTWRPNSIADARYDKPGVAGAWMSAIVRLWEIDGEQRYSFEVMQGDQLKSEEFMGTKDEVINRFFNFNRAMLKDGYKRMNFSPGPDPEFSVLQ